MNNMQHLFTALLLISALGSVCAVQVGKFDVQVTFDPPQVRVVSTANPDKVAFESDPNVPFLQLREGAFNKKAIYEGNDMWDMKSKRLTKTLTLQKKSVKDGVL